MTIDVESIMQVPLGRLIQDIDERSLANALHTAINRGIEMGRQQAADDFNRAIVLERLKYFPED